MKVALIQRIIPHYRVDIFEMLNKELDGGLTILYGDGEKEGSQQNAKELKNLRVEKLKTLKMSIKYNKISYFMPVYLDTYKKLKRVKADVVICEGGKVNLLNIYITLIYSVLNKTPYILWVPGPLNNKKSLLKNITDALLEFAVKKSTACIAYSSMAEEYLKQIKDGNSIFKAQNTIFIDTDKYNSQEYIKKIECFKEKYNLINKKIILYVGALEKRKNVDLLINSFVNIGKPDYSLLIIGDGPEKDNLKKIANDNVIFLGRVVRDVEMYFNMCDIFVLPGQGGLGINQAIAFGKPIICTKCDGTEVDLVNGNGYIINPMIVDNLSNAILTILEDEKLCDDMGKVSRGIDKKVNAKSMIENIKKCILYSIK